VSRRAGLPEAPLRVVNLGLEAFALDLAAEGVAVVHVDWRPPAGDPAVADWLDALDDDDDDA